MAVTTRYFAPSAAGAGDGTSWANRAALYTGGAWSTVLTAHDFVTTGPMLAYVQGSNTIGDQLTSADFSVSAPTAASWLQFHGCDSSGNPLTPPDPNWTADMPEFDDSTLPVLDASGNFTISNLAHCYWRLMKLTGASRTSGQLLELNSSGASSMEWCVVHAAASGASVGGYLHGGFGRVSNCVIRMSGTSYSYVVAINNNGFVHLSNVKLRGNPSASAGVGILSIAAAQAGITADRICVYGNPGAGITLATSTNAATWVQIINSVVANNGGSGIVLGTLGSLNSRRSLLNRLMLTGNGGYGVDFVNSNNLGSVHDTRFRDNTSGTTTNMNDSQNFNPYTTDSDDATEYVDASNGDFRIKYGAVIHGKGFGVSEQSAPPPPALTEIDGGVYAPNITDLVSSTGSHILDASGERFAMIFHAPKAGTLHKVWFATGTVTTGDTLRVSFQDLDASGDPDGTQDQYRDVVVDSADDNIWKQTGILSNDGTDGGTKRVVTLDQALSIVLEYPSYVAGNLSIRSGDTAVGSNPLSANDTAYVDHYTAGAWSRAAKVCLLVLEYSDGSIEVVQGCASAAAANQAVNTGTTPDEVALYIEFPVEVEVSGFTALVDLDANCDIVLYDVNGTTPLETVSLAAVNRVGTAASVARRMFQTPHTLAANTRYYLAIKPTTGSSISIRRLDVQDVSLMDALPMGTDATWVERTDAGTWAETTTRRPALALLVSKIHSGSVAGGILTHSGMLGGIRG